MFWPRQHNTKYCNRNCRAKAARTREKATVEQYQAQEKGHEVHDNPTTAVLDAHAMLVVLTDRIYMFDGIVPDWQAPNGVDWYRNDAGKWQMSKAEARISPENFVIKQ